MNRVRATGYVPAFLLFTTLAYGLPGSGTADDPYRIQSLEDFDRITVDLSSTFIESHIRLECELDLTSRTFYAACIQDFKGVFDGNHQPIRNLHIEAGTRDTAGFFGSCHSARIQNMDFVSPNVSGYLNVGVLCGYSETSIFRDCTITGMTMFVHRFAGGLVGKDYGSTITGCTISGGITGHEDFGTVSRFLGGLIGYAGSETGVEDCQVNMTIKPYPSHRADSVGGLIGDLGQGTVRRCFSVATLDGGSFVGGLLGESIWQTNVVEDCFAEAIVTGADNVGGLIGRNGNGTSGYDVGGIVRRCASQGTVQCGSYGGGLIGYDYSGPILQCRSDSTVLGSSSYIGGLIGYSGVATIQECRSNSMVSGIQYVGGLIGVSGAAVSDCLALGTASSTSSYRGGLFGSGTGSVTRCYAAVNLPGVSSNRGGLIGKLYSPGTISKCFWDKSIQTSGLTVDIGSKSGTVTVTDIFGKTTSEMMTQSTFTAYGWDFANEAVNGTADLWRLCTDGTVYPRLSWEYPRQDLTCPDGVGVEDLLVLSAQWLATGLPPNTGPDFSGDGGVALEDLAILSSVWLKTP